MHQMKTPFSGTPRSPDEGVDLAAGKRAGVNDLAPGSEPGPPPAVTDGAFPTRETITEFPSARPLSSGRSLLASGPALSIG